MKRTLQFAPLALAIGLAFGPALADAATITKANNTDNLDLGSSWTGGTAPGTSDVGQFDTSIIGTGGNTYDYTSDLAWDQLRVDLTSGSAAGGSITLDSSTGNSLTVDAFRASADVGTTANYLTGSGILLNSGPGASLTINDPVVFAPASNSAAMLTSSRSVTLNGTVGFGANTFDIYQAGNTTNIAGVLTGSGAITKLGNGELILGGNNTSLSSAINLNGGTVRAANSNNALGTGAITVVGNTTLATASGGGARNLANDITINSTKTLSADGGYADLTLSGDIGGAGGLTKTSIGNVILSGTNSYTGTTTVFSSGNLKISGATNTGAGAVSIAAGTLTVTNGGSFTGTGTVSIGAGTLAVANGGSFTTTGAANSGSGSGIDVNAGGSLTVGSLTSSYAPNPFTVNGTLNITGTFTPSWATNKALAGTGTVNIGNYRSQNYSTLTINTGLTFNVSGPFFLGNNATDAGFNQSAGTVNVNSSTANDFRIGHWSGATGTYNLSGGVLNASGINTVVGWDGPGVFNISGGTANLKGIELSKSGHVAAGTLTLTGGTMNIGSGGIFKGGSGTATVSLGAGTVGARGADWASSLGMALTDASTGTTVNTLDSVNSLTARTITLSGDLTGTGNLNKAGDGTLILSGAGNSYAGTTNVNGGTLLVNGSNTGSGAVTVAVGAILGGSGSLAATTTVNGIVSPGNSIGTLSVGDTTINGNYLLETASGSQSDLLAVTGVLTLGASSVLDLDAGSSLVANEIYTIASYTTESGTFGTVDSAITATHFVDYSTGNQIRLVPVPEPGSFALLMLGAAGFWAASRKRRA